MAKAIFLEACVKNSVHSEGGGLLLVPGGGGVCFWPRGEGGVCFWSKRGVCFWSRGVSAFGPGGDLQAHTQGGKMRGICSRPTPKGEIKGDLVQAYSQGGS